MVELSKAKGVTIYTMLYSGRHTPAFPVWGRGRQHAEVSHRSPQTKAGHCARQLHAHVVRRDQVGPHDGGVARSRPAWKRCGGEDLSHGPSIHVGGSAGAHGVVVQHAAVRIEDSIHHHGGGQHSVGGGHGVVPERQV